MHRVGRRSLTVALGVGLLLPTGAAHAAEGQVGSAPRPFTSQFDDVPGLRAGTTARGAGVEDGGVFIQTRPRRCQALASLGAALLPRPLSTYGRRLGRTRLRLLGAGPRSFPVDVYRRNIGGVDPTSVVTLTGRVPRQVAPDEPRRFLAFSVVLTSEEEGCLRSVSRAAPRLARTLYVRQRAAAPRIAPLHSPGRRIDGGAPARIGGPQPNAALGSEIEAAGDLDGDGRGDVLLQERARGEHGTRRRGLVRFGGRPGLIDSARFGPDGFAIAGGPEAAVYGSTFAPAGDFTGGPTDALAAAIEGRHVQGFRPPPGRDVVAVVMPGRRYRGFVDPRRPPAGSVRVTVPRGCGSTQPRVENVGDVNGDGRDDLFVARPEECRPELAGIVFGGRSGPIALEALGADGIQLDPKQLDDRAPVRAGDVNGDGLDDMAFVGGDLYEESLTELVLMLGRREAGARSVRSGPGLVRVRRRGCEDLGDVAPAGDLDGDGAGELVIGVDECPDRLLRPAVAHVLRGGRSLPPRIRIGPRTGTTVQARFGPLGPSSVAAGRDVSGGPAPDIALGFPGGGPNDEGETWVLRDVGTSGTLTLGALGQAGVRLLGGREGSDFGSDVALVGDGTGDRRAELLVGAPEEDFAGRSLAGTVYTYAAGAAPGPPCRRPRAGAGRLWGTDLGDLLTGSPGPDRLIGFEGGDCLRGLAGRDRLVGDPGPDRLDGGPGDDRLNGGTGRDALAGGTGNDLLLGGARGDAMTGGPGRDRIDARDGAGDLVDAGAGNDFIRASDRGSDRIDCGPGRDVVVADRGDRLRRCERVRRYSPPVYDD